MQVCVIRLRETGVRSSKSRSFGSTTGYELLTAPAGSGNTLRSVLRPGAGSVQTNQRIHIGHSFIEGWHECPTCKTIRVFLPGNSFIAILCLEQVLRVA